MTSLTHYSKREFVEDPIGHRMVTVFESPFARTPHAGYGALNLVEAILDVPPGQTKRFAGVEDFELVSLVLFRGASPGKQDTKIERLVQLPLHFQEVKSFQAIGESDMNDRLIFARHTGFLLLGPDECIAVLHQTDDGSYTFCEVYENNDLGRVRSLAGFYAGSIDYEARIRRISDLNVIDTKQATSKAVGDMYWWAGQTEVVSPLQIDRMHQTLTLLKAHEPNAPDARTESGAVRKVWFIDNGSVDSLSHLTRCADGWVRYPTWQDAWYFGAWVNPRKLEMITYAEQDVSHVICETKEQFAKELADMARFFGMSRRPSMFCMGKDGSEVSFEGLTFLKGNVKTICFDTGARAKNENGEWNVPLSGTIKLDHPLVEQLANGDSIELPSDAFEMDLLDIRTFEPGYAATALKSDGELIVALKLNGSDAGRMSAYLQL